MSQCVICGELVPEGWQVCPVCIEKAAINKNDTENILRGKWEKHPQYIGYKRCSVCHECNILGEWIENTKWKYCPHCGARMDGEL